MSNIASKTCEVCLNVQSKYRCPRCQLCSCSLECVKKHKEKTNCSGERDKTAFVSLNDFNETHLISDYKYLEESQRDVETCDKKQPQNKNANPKYLKILKHSVMKKGVRLKTMPGHMTRHKLNRSYYNIQNNVIEWSIEWCIHNCEEKFYSSCYDHKKIGECLKNFFSQFCHNKITDPEIKPTNTEDEPKMTKVLTPASRVGLGCEECMRLQERCKYLQNVHHPHLTSTLQTDLADLTVFLKVEPMCKRRDDVNKYVKLDFKDVLSNVLAGRCFIEFPTFILCPSSSSSYYSHQVF